MRPSPSDPQQRRFALPVVDRYLALALLLAIPALLPLAAPGYFFDAHDGRHTVFWLFQYDRAFGDGTFWPLWVPDHVQGFGYPLWLIYAPFGFFVAEMFHLLGLGLTAAIKAAWALWFIVGAAGVYVLARRWWGKPAGLIASLAYTYAPYHLVDIYVRAAYAEFASLAIAPWTLLALDRVWEQPRGRYVAQTALAFALLLITHSMAPAVYGPLLAGYVFLKMLQWVVRAVREQQSEAARQPASARPRIRYGDPLLLTRWRRRLRPLLASISALALGLGLAMFFWLPALLGRRYLQDASWLQGTYDYARHFVYPSQLWSTFWGFGYSVPGPDDGMSFQLGLPQWIAAVIGGAAALGAAHLSLRTRRAEAIFLLIVCAGAIFAMTPAARPLWDAFPLAASVQFPWRLLTLTTIAAALLAGAAARALGGTDGDDLRRTPYVFVVALDVPPGELPLHAARADADPAAG